MRWKSLSLAFIVAFGGVSNAFAAEWEVNYPSGGNPISTGVSITATGTFPHADGDLPKVALHQKQVDGTYLEIRPLDYADSTMGDTWNEPLGTLPPGWYKVELRDDEGNFKDFGNPFEVRMPMPIPPGGP